MAKDFIGNNIRKGAHVIFIEKDHRNFKTGRIIKETPSKFLIEYKIKDTYVSKNNIVLNKTKTAYRFHNKVIKI